MWATEREVMANQRIFVTEDDPATCRLLQDLLADEGYTEVQPVARHELVAAARHEPPAVLLLDVPGAQAHAGRALLSQLRCDPRTASIAVIICSTMRHEKWRQSVEESDIGDGYVEKPFYVADLVGQIRTLLGPPSHDLTA